MGTFSVTVSVGDPQGRRFEQVEVLVDTGATNTGFPDPRRRQLRVEPYRKSAFELADGRRAELDIGRTVVFIPEGARPVHRRLVPVPKLLA